MIFYFDSINLVYQSSKKQKLKRKLTLFAFLSTLCGYGQEKEIFKDTYQDGQAEYEYYTNESYDIIFDGFFKYFGEKYDVEGSYKENLPNGQWNIKANNKVFSNWQFKIVINTSVVGSYLNGYLNGKWTFENSFAFDSDRQDKDIDKSTAQFDNNTFIGEISFNRNFQEIEINGQFDKHGLLSGTWTYKKPYEIDIIKYNNGVAYWRLIRDLPTQEKTLLIDSTEFVQSFWTNYNPESSISIINQKAYYPDTVIVRGENRVSNGLINLSNINIETNRRTYDNPAIKLWTDINVDVFQSYSAPNPLYYGVKNSITPKAYEIVIKECVYETSYSTSHKFISNQSCLSALNEIRLQKEKDKDDRNSFHNRNELYLSISKQLDSINQETIKISSQLESYGSDFSSGFEKSMNMLLTSLTKDISSIEIQENFTKWSEKDNLEFETLKAMESQILNVESYVKNVSDAVNNKDKKRLKLLKDFDDINELLLEMKK